MSHDQLFKTLLKGYFYDFLRLFLPPIAAAIDPDRITFLDPTNFTTQPEGDYRIADVVAQVEPRDAPPSRVILHTEVESEPEATFGYRMWEYNALLTLERQPPVVSIALLPFLVGKGIELARYTEAAFGQEYTKLEYWRISLRGLDAAEYLAAEPALGAALAALMRPAPEVEWT